MMNKTFAIALCLLLIISLVFTSVGCEATDGNENVGEEEDKSKGESVSLEDENVTQDDPIEILNWTGDSEKKSDNITITIASKNKITAHFEKEKTGTPLLPKEPRPEDEAEGVGDHEVNVDLSVLVEHEVERKMDVEFYDASNDDLIGVDKNVESGERANITWEGLANAAKYEWYAVTDDGEETARSDSWRFLTWGEQEESKVTTDRVENVTVSSTTLHGTFDRIGTTFAVDVFFEWRKSDDNTWNETPKQTMNSEGKFHHELIDLQPETKYEFRSVSDHSGPGSVLTFTTKPGSESYNITIEIGGKGTVKVDGEEIETGWTHEYEEGTEVTIEVVPQDGWELTGWAEDTDGEGDTIEINMDSDKEITANFQEIENGDNNGSNDESIPGFTSMLLVFSAFIAVILYQKYNK